MKFKQQFVCGILVLYTTISFTGANGEGKKIKLVLDKLEKVKDAEHILKTELTFDKVGDEEVKINGQIEQAVDLNDDYKLTTTILHSSEKDGEYKKVIGFEDLGVCHVMATKYKNFFYDSLKDYANAPDPDACPVTKETYVIKGYPLDSSKFQKFLRPGFYKIISSLKHESEEVLQYNVEAHTEEE